MQIVMKKIDELIPYINNPRHNDSAVDAVASSIKHFGFKVPIVIDQDNEIINGHTRLKAAKKLGWKEVPCIVATDLTPQQVKAYRLADNKVAEIATWDDEALQLEIEELGDFFTDFDMEAMGFTLAEEKDLEITKPEQAPINYTNDFILEPEIIEELKQKKVFFNFSGGKDSSVAAFLTIPILKREGIDFELVFVDTGVEIPSTQEFVIRFAEHYGARLHIVRSGKDFFEHYEKKKQWPNAIFRDCIDELINKPSNNYMKSTLEEGEEFIVIRGGRPNQKTLKAKMQKIYTTGGGTRLLNPLYDLTEEGFEKYLNQLKEGIGVWEGYERGFVRTACWCCPFQRKAQYDVMKKELPFLWEVLKRKALEWDFKGVTPLDRYLNNDMELVDKAADDYDSMALFDEFDSID